MPSSTALLAVLRTDMLRAARDRFLIAMFLYLVGTAAAMRGILPLLARTLRARSGFELDPFYPLLVSYLTMVLGALAVGVVGGFLLLETREEGSIRALSVSPLRVTSYLRAYAAILGVSAALLITAEAAVIGLGLPPWHALIPLAVVGGLFAPAISLYLATFANDKVAAFAQMKLVGVAGLVPLLAGLTPPPWQYVASLFPPFWAVKGWWIAESGGDGWAWWALGGGLLSSAWLYLLTRRFRALTG